MGSDVIIGMAAALLGATGEAESTRAPTTEVRQSAVIENGVEQLCGWFVRGDGYSLPAAQQVAADAGFRTGANVMIVRTPELAAAGSYSALNFTAEGGGSEPAGRVVAFMAFHGPVCQVQVYGYAQEAGHYVSGLEGKGWTLIERQKKDPIAAERWIKGSNGDQITLVVNRWIGAGPAPADLGFILNVYPGDNRTMGAFLPQ